MTPHTRKMAIQSMITALRNRTMQLSKEFQQIREGITALRNNPQTKGHLVCQTAGEVLDELEAVDHAGKLKTLTECLTEILEDVRHTDPHEDFSPFMEQVSRAEQEVSHHFTHVLPPLHAKMASAMRTQSELN